MKFQNKTLIFGLILILSACGQKGPLTINTPKPPTETVEQQAAQSNKTNEKINQKEPLEEQYQ